MLLNDSNSFHSPPLMAQIISVRVSEYFFLVYNSVNKRFNHHVVLLSHVWKNDMMEISLTNKE